MDDPEVKWALRRVNTPTYKKENVTEALMTTRNQYDLGFDAEVSSMAYAPLGAMGLSSKLFFVVVFVLAQTLFILHESWIAQISTLKVWLIHLDKLQ